MNKKNILISAVVVLVLAVIATAILPAYPPPVNQKIGINDTNVIFLNTELCRSCHNPGGTFAQGSNTTQYRHHLLEQSGEYTCVACHPRLPLLGGGTYVVYEKSCLNCHNGSTFWANAGLTPGIPHHNTTLAWQALNCTACHGGYVDTYPNTGKIPTTPPSEVTPNTSFKPEATNTTTGRKWGGCESCHIANATIQTFPIWDNNNTHHNLGKVTDGYPVVSSGCVTCHNVTGNQIGALNIRTCETCHGIKSLHNIQYNYTGTINVPGYGHIGDGDKDCLGCHAWYVAGELSPTVPVPEINTITPSDMVAGVATDVTIVGSNLAGATVAVDGTVIGGTGNDNQIVVTLPALAAGTHTIDVVKADNVRSRLYSLAVVTKVDATLAKITSKAKTPPSVQITITGTGFGRAPVDSLDPRGVWVTVNGKKGPQEVKTTVVSWSDTQIVVSTKSASVNNPVTVKALFGQDTVNIS